MGVEYDVVSDATREAYELGKGAWSEIFEAAKVLSYENLEACIAGWFGVGDRDHERELRDWCGRVARELKAFLDSHPDAKLVNDACHDYATYQEQPDEYFKDFSWEQWPQYKLVGSRYVHRSG